MSQINFAEALAKENVEATPHSTSWTRSERANIFFAGITIAGGLFCAFYFFNGGELLHPRAVVTRNQVEVVNSDAPAQIALPERPNERPLLTADPSGDPFSGARKLISLDRSLRSFGHGGGLSAAVPGPAISGVPGLPGGPVGGLPGSGPLVSRLILLAPGGDALTQILRPVTATASPNLVVTRKHTRY